MALIGIPGLVSDGLWWFGALGVVWPVLVVAAGVTLATVDLWWPHVEHRFPRQAARTKHHCSDFADELAAFAEARRQEPALAPSRLDNLRSLADLESSGYDHGARARSVTELRSFRAETMRRYHDEFRVRGVRLLHRVRTQVPVENADLELLCQPRSVDDMGAIARRFYAYADQLAVQRPSRSRAS